MLVLVYTFNFIDRQIVGILAVPIKADLGLTDTQLGLMGGLAFALFYTALGIPIAMLADRSNRTTIMTVALVLWSAMTAVCGFAQNFWQLFLARLGVGVGEAGGVAPAYSIVADYFPPHQRARALGVYSFGVPIGSALGIVFGGFIAHHVDWRTAFIVVGIAGVADRAGVQARGARAAARALRRRARRGQPVSFREVMRVLLCQARVLGHLVRRGRLVDDGLRPVLLAAVVLRAQPRHDAARCVAVLRRDPAGRRHRRHLDGRLARRPLRRGRAGATTRSFRRSRSSPPCRSTWAPSPRTRWPCRSCCSWCPRRSGSCGSGRCCRPIQHIVPPGMRATASAIFLFVNNLIGIGLGLGGARRALRRAVGALRRRLAALRDPRRHDVLLRRGGAVPAVGEAAWSGTGSSRKVGHAPALAVDG